MEGISTARMLLNSILANKDLWEEFNYEPLELLINHVNSGKLKITPIISYSSQVFLLSFEKDTQKFVIKIRAISAVMKLKMEVLVFRILSKQITVPEVILYGNSCGYEVIIYRHLDSISNHNDILNEIQIYGIWKLILVIQNTLFESLNPLDLHINNSQNYASEIHRYTIKYVEREIPLISLEMINERLNLSSFSDSITVFSDRGPVNWIIGVDNIIPIDFDLLLLEPRLADFIQFIDHHELHTVYNRDSLISKCLSFLSSNGIYFTKEDFHWHALYRNLTQGAIFYKVNKEISLLHYKKALCSSNVLNEKLLNKQIKKILNEVAWI
jgi:hypothetical protein